MSLKAELETWSAALKAYDEEDFEKSLDLFSRIADSSKILTNMGLIYATLGEHEAAVERFIEATGLDQYLAVAYFQCGVSNFLLARYDLALKDFEEALLYLRGNQAINYEQLGLKFRLFSAEVLFNKGLAQIYLGRTQEGMADMEEARRDKATDEHAVIDDAIADRGEGYTVFSIPVGVLYRPSEKKVKNAVTKDYMGKAKLVAASDPGDVNIGFKGYERLQQGITPSGVFVDRDNAALNRSATAPSASLPKVSADVENRPLARSKTTLNVVPNARGPGGGDDQARSPGGASGPGVQRSATQITPGRPSPAAGQGIGGPVRGLSVRKPGGPGGNEPAPPPKEQGGGGGGSRLTEFYDDYLDSYSDQPPVPPLRSEQGPQGGSDRVAAWARSNAAPSPGPQRQMSRSAPNSAYAPSSFGGGSMRRRLTRRPTRATSRAVSTYYEDDEEGYVSGEYDDGPFELVKIRVKLHYQDDVRGMALTPETPFEEFLEKVTAKFDRDLNGLGLRFTDEDGGKVTLRDESDYELAIETAREHARGKPEGKLEIWCTDK
ncbi:NADPH oxidase regulator NoxR [Flagelloscypha sp. PMI_526]|nr:NADPH oxidase regulator NoxR [Flagelloscypha sp. PMI_526]